MVAERKPRVGARQRRAVRIIAEFVVAAGVAVGVQFAALPDACRLAASRALLAVIGLRL